MGREYKLLTAFGVPRTNDKMDLFQLQDQLNEASREGFRLVSTEAISYPTEISSINQLPVAGAHGVVCFLERER